MNPMPAQNVFRLHPPDDWPASGIIPVNRQQEWPGTKPVQHDVTRILKRIQDGEIQLADSLLPLVYKELRNLARARMAAEKPGQTLQATALVHEAYIRLVGNDEITWDSRGHFFPPPPRRCDES